MIMINNHSVFVVATSDLRGGLGLRIAGTETVT